MLLVSLTMSDTCFSSLYSRFYCVIDGMGSLELFKSKDILLAYPILNSIIHLCFNIVIDSQIWAGRVPFSWKVRLK